MKTTEFTMPEITISYKDNVKASERVKILSSETSYTYLKPFYAECMEHHEESHVMFLNRANKALGVSLISKGGMAETVMDVKIILQTALKVHASGIILSQKKVITVSQTRGFYKPFFYSLITQYKKPDGFYFYPLKQEKNFP